MGSTIANLKKLREEVESQETETATSQSETTTKTPAESADKAKTASKVATKSKSTRAKKTTTKKKTTSKTNPTATARSKDPSFTQATLWLDRTVLATLDYIQATKYPDLNRQEFVEIILRDYIKKNPPKLQPEDLWVYV